MSAFLRPVNEIHPTLGNRNAVGDGIRSLNRGRRSPFRCEKRRGRQVAPPRIGPAKRAPGSTVALQQAKGERSISITYFVTIPRVAIRFSSALAGPTSHRSNPSAPSQALPHMPNPLSLGLISGSAADGPCGRKTVRGECSPTLARSRVRRIGAFHIGRRSFFLRGSLVRRTALCVRIPARCEIGCATYLRTSRRRNLGRDG